METKREADPLLSRENLQSRVSDYTSGQDPAAGLVSPVLADLSGLPRLSIHHALATGFLRGFLITAAIGLLALIIALAAIRIPREGLSGVDPLATPAE
jgi:hypothetical protein